MATGAGNITLILLYGLASDVLIPQRIMRWRLSTMKRASLKVERLLRLSPTGEELLLSEVENDESCSFCAIVCENVLVGV